MFSWSYGRSTILWVTDAYSTKNFQWNAAQKYYTHHKKTRWISAYLISRKLTFPYFNVFGCFLDLMVIEQIFRWTIRILRSISYKYDLLGTVLWVFLTIFCAHSSVTYIIFSIFRYTSKFVNFLILVRSYRAKTSEIVLLGLFYIKIMILDISELV